MQATKAWPSRLHSKAEPGSSEVKCTVADVATTEPLGPAATVVWGSTESSCQSGAMSWLTVVSICTDPVPSADITAMLRSVPTVPT